MPANGPEIVEYTRESKDVHHYRLGSHHVSEIALDYTGVEYADRGSAAMQFIGASAVHCLAGTVATFLEGRGVVIHSLTGRATVEQDTNSERRVQVSRLKVEVEVEIDDKDAEMLEKARLIIEERGCLITYSLQKAMQVEHIIRRKP